MRGLRVNRQAPSAHLGPSEDLARPDRYFGTPDMGSMSIDQTRPGLLTGTRSCVIDRWSLPWQLDNSLSLCVWNLEIILAVVAPELTRNNLAHRFLILASSEN